MLITIGGEVGRRGQMLKMRREGKTLAEIGRAYGVSRQRVNAILREFAEPERLECAISAAERKRQVRYRRAVTTMCEGLRRVAKSNEQHGVVNMYVNRGCHCAACRRAYAEYRNRKYHEKMEKRGRVASQTECG